MRIGIDARFLTHPQEGGFKTYTENLVCGLAALDRLNDYVLYTDRPVRRDTSLPDNFNTKPVGGPAIVREQILLPLRMARDRIALAHFPCNTAPLIQPCPTVLTVHDMIPFISSRKAQRKANLKSRTLAYYWRTVMPRAARRAACIITVSQSSKKDIEKMLHVPADRISVVPPGLHPHFRPVEHPEEVQRVRNAHRLPDRFILGFVSSDPRKNARGILEATGLASRQLEGIGIVLICSSAAARDMAADLDSRYRDGLSWLTLLDPVPRGDLAVIYSLAEALVFPSLYEGFGLPVVEAMACGTPVVASDTSSLPEVAGDAALLADPKDAKRIAEALVRLVTDRGLRAELVRRGRERASRFSRERTARETIAVYENACSMAKCGAEAGIEGRLAGGKLG